MPKPDGKSTDGDSDDMNYYRCVATPALQIVIGDPDPSKGEVAPRFVRFEPFFEELRGVEGKVKVGYLKTDNGSAIKKLEADANVQLITKDEYEQATTAVFDNGNPPVQIAGVRAPY